MRLFQIKFPAIETYDWIIGNDNYEKNYGEQRAKALAQLAARTEALTKLGVIFLETDKTSPVVVTERQMTDLFMAGIQFEPPREIKHDDEDPTDLNGVMRKFNRMAARLMSLPGLQNTPQTHTAYNERCEVHMPGQALATYNEVLLMESACSDELQTALDKGWRMIAACPQPDARRPDYILGRYNPERDPSFFAARSPE